VPVRTYQCSGCSERSAQAEAGEDGKEQQNCEASDGECHGGSVGVVCAKVKVDVLVRKG
jgi:hypothetical protein